jgi:serine/threonine protein kinase
MDEAFRDYSHKAEQLSVLLAETKDPRLGREVAIKVLPSGSAPDSEHLRRFEQEARATAALNHPNILAVFDIRSQDNSPYIVSELLEGETLRARLNSSPLPLRKAVDYALQIVRGLAAAHDHGIFHRDLKPENIFVTRDSHVKILDFGLAKLTMPERGAPGSSEATLDSVTGRGVLLGTLGYMSPEQCRGAAIDARSDIFSFGAVLYEMISGRRAFRGDTTADTISSILKEEPPDVSATGRDVPPMLERIIHHCLEKDPAARFQSASDIAFALEALSSISASAAGIAATPAVAAPTPRKSWLVPALAGAIAVLVVAVVLLVVRVSAPPPEPPSYRQLTFARESISSARFAPDQRTIIYSTSHVGMQTELFSLAPDSHAPVSLGLKDADVESISSTGEMLLIQQRHSLVRVARIGVLGRAMSRMPTGARIARSQLLAMWRDTFASSTPSATFCMSPPPAM